MLLKPIYLFIFSSFLTCVAFAREKVVLNAEDDWPPYSSAQSGKLEGFAVDLNKAIFNAVDVDVEFKTVSYARCVFDLKQDINSIGCFDTGRSRANENDFLWPESPLFSAKVLIWVRKDSAEKDLTFFHLKGKRVGVTNGYEYGAQFDSSEAKSIDKDTAISDEDSFKKLNAGHVDYIVAYENPARAVLLEMPLVKNMVKPAGVLSTIKLYTSFSKKNPKARHFLQLYNKGMKIIQSNGVYQKLEAALEKKLKS